MRLSQVKIPVTDLRRSVSWYRELLDLGLWREFVEHGVLSGAVLADANQDLRIGLRLREVIPGTPAFPGFDLFSLAVDSLDELGAVVARCDDLGLAHGDVTTRGADDAIVDVPDPDGTVIRFVYLSPERERGFAGVDLRSDRPPTSYGTSRLGI